MVNKIKIGDRGALYSEIPALHFFFPERGEERRFQSNQRIREAGNTLFQAILELNMSMD